MRLVPAQLSLPRVSQRPRCPAQGGGSLKGARFPRSFIRSKPFAAALREADAFDETAFIGLARLAKRDPYRLSLFAHHLEPDERPLVVLPIQGGTLVVTDARLLELRAHLEVHGAWNVKQFQGYAVQRAIERQSVRDVLHDVQAAMDPVGNRRMEDRLLLESDAGRVDWLVSKGPEPTLSDEDFQLLRRAVLGPQAK
jgi:hypothetical protein